jgi:hypothetical protein
MSKLGILEVDNEKRTFSKALPGLEPGFWEFVIRIPSDNHYTIAPLDRI